MGNSIKAVQWTGDNLKQIVEYLGITIADWDRYVRQVQEEGLVVYNSSGMIRVNIGEWIEREPDGLNVRVYSI